MTGTPTGGLRLRRLEPEDLPRAAELSGALRWPHRLEDWQFAFKLGEGIAAERDGRLVGTALAWRFGEHHATLGMVIVAPEEQGLGIGRRLMEALLQALGDRSVLLHATADGRALYERLDFVAVGTLQQHQGTATPAPIALLQPGERVRPMGRADAAALALLDRQAVGMPRDDVLAALLESAQGVVLDHDGVATGFALLRRFGRGQLIGPVVAPDLRGAQALIGHWLSHCARQFVRIDVPADSGLGEWLEGLGLPCVGPVDAMVRGPALERGVAPRLFATITQALG